MLEKIGLPAKPSVRGSNWVVDASHCQGCSSQFTFINRKHHCRRCGGLFCNSCTQQRMYLRGQGDSQVRICDPCKKLEEAARFEMRHGHKNKTSRGGSKATPKLEDEVLDQILGTDLKKPSLSGREATISNVFSDFERNTSNASSSNLHEGAFPHDGKVDSFRSSSIDTNNDTPEEIGSSSPEELRQLSLEEKQKYKILKGEGKPEEALRAFKRGKELERQANALEVQLRKNKRKVLSSSSVAGKTNDDSEGLSTKRKLSSRMDKEEKNDLSSELRDLGWSDADLHIADKEPTKMSLEGELKTLLGEAQKTAGGVKGTGSIDKTQVIELKKKALLFKREGKLAEAKEELKKAKVLEKQLEEQEFLAEADDSDDELSSLIRSLDDGKKDDLSLLDLQNTGIDFNHLAAVPDDFALDGNFDVTEEDMEDPEIGAALESLGWTEDSEHPVVPSEQSVPGDRKTLSDEVLALKKEAIRQKRSGNVEEAMSLLRKAKLLERDAESLQPNPSTPTNKNISTSQTAGSFLSMKVEGGIIEASPTVDPKLPPKSKLVIQRELLGLKRRALVLKREGRLDEAEEELRKGKLLENQLEEMESRSRVRATGVSVSSTVSESAHRQPFNSGVGGLEDQGDEVNVTEQDMQDPTLLSLLENLGWKDEVKEPENFPSSSSILSDSHPDNTVGPLVQSAVEIAVQAPKRSKADIQRELLGLKRKAFTLRRQGETEEAEEVLRTAKLLEAQMEEIEVSKKESLPKSVTNTPDAFESPAAQEAVGNWFSSQSAKPSSESLPNSVTNTPDAFESLVAPEVVGNWFSSQTTKPSSESSLKEVTKGVSDLSVGSEDAVPKMSTVAWKNNTTPMCPSITSISTPGTSLDTEGKTSLLDPVPPADSKLLHDEILAHKRRAVALKREDKLAEAREELRQAKLLEKSLQEDKPQPVAGSMDAFNDTSFVQEEHVSVQQAPKLMTTRDRFKLQRESLAHKRQALKLRREGRMEEAEAESELAKALETQLEESSGNDSSHLNKSANETGRDDLGVEDFLDPQLLSALKAIGLQDAEFVPQASNRSEGTKSHVVKGDSSATSSEEKSQLEERIKAEKVKAVNLKRAGKQAEALDALRRAKLYEKKLNTLT